MLRKNARSANDRAPDSVPELLRQKGLRRYGLFYVVGEGETLPDGSEAASGYVVDDCGRIFFFWVGWDDRCRGPTFTEWEEVVETEADRADPEYRRAREAAGLPSA